MRIWMLVVVSALLGCEPASIMLGGLGQGLSGGRNQGLDAVERKHRRQDEAARMNRETCFFLLDQNNKQFERSLSFHQSRMSGLEAELRVFTADTIAPSVRIAAYESYDRRAKEELARWSGEAEDLQQKGKDLENKCGSM